MITPERHFRDVCLGQCPEVHRVVCSAIAKQAFYGSAVITTGEIRQAVHDEFSKAGYSSTIECNGPRQRRQLDPLGIPGGRGILKLVCGRRESSV